MDGWQEVAGAISVTVRDALNLDILALKVRQGTCPWGRCQRTSPNRQPCGASWCPRRERQLAHLEHQMEPGDTGDQHYLSTHRALRCPLKWHACHWHRRRCAGCLAWLARSPGTMTHWSPRWSSQWRWRWTCYLRRLARWRQPWMPPYQWIRWPYWLIFPFLLRFI